MILHDHTLKYSCFKECFFNLIIVYAPSSSSFANNTSTTPKHVVFDVCFFFKKRQDLWSCMHLSIFGFFFKWMIYFIMIALPSAYVSQLGCTVIVILQFLICYIFLLIPLIFYGGLGFQCIWIIYWSGFLISIILNISAIIKVSACTYIYIYIMPGSSWLLNAAWK